MFIRPKPNNKWRLIINLSTLNHSIRKEHFKMDNINVALDLLFPGAFMASIDLRDAYYTLPLSKSFQPYVCFQWDGKVYQFHAMPFGLTSAPRIFTKVMKVPMATLGQKGIRIFDYINNLFILADSLEECKYSVVVTCKLLQRLGFFINSEKSTFLLSTKMIFLGFELNYYKMIVSPTEKKVIKTKEFITSVLNSNTLKIRTVASLVGVLNDLTKGVDYGIAHVKGIEREKNFALTEAGVLQFEAYMSLQSMARSDLIWWYNHLDSAFRKIRIDIPTVTVY